MKYLSTSFHLQSGRLKNKKVHDQIIGRTLMLQFCWNFKNADRRQLDWYGVGINSRTCTGLRCKNLLLPGCPGSPCRTHFPVDCVEKEKPAAPAAAEPAGPGPSSPAPLKPPRSDDEASEVSSSDSSSSDSDSSSTSNESEKPRTIANLRTLISAMLK